jgi:hypothetical protein
LKEKEMPLFEVAVIEHPTKKEMEDGAVEKLVFGPTAIIAKDPQAAGVGAILGAKDTSFDPQKIEVLVRPFAKKG